MVKVACFDLGYADEDYSISNCKKYGGGAVVGRYFKQLDNFHLYAPEKSFENLDSNDRKENCFILSEEKLSMLRNGHPIDDVISNITDYDIVLHGHGHYTFNRTSKLKSPVVHWSGFDGRCGHHNNNYILLYRNIFSACYGERSKYVKLGKHVPKVFESNEKRNGIFQCTQHCDDFNTIFVAIECLKYNIKGYFAGPIREGYPLLNYIDNINTFYLGVISEKDKLEYTKNALLYTLPITCEVTFNQSAIEANGLGTPILTRRVGWFNEYVKHGVNGFFYDSDNFLDLYNGAKLIDQKSCWNSARQYSIEEMQDTFYKAFNEIYSEWYGK
jgi:hypothetical protein